MKTSSIKLNEIDRKWYLVDANDKILGRLSSKIAQIIRGKNKVNFTPHIDMSDYVAAELDYRENYTKKQLSKIADYYQISKRKKKKDDLIEEIVIFEKDPSNFHITDRRKTLWYYMQEIKNDNYLSKFLILD